MLKPLERKLIPTGLYISLPEGYEAQMRPRSGLALKHGITLLNTPGTIDADYRGEIGIILVNLSSEPFTVNDGERICQMVIAAHSHALDYSLDLLKLRDVYERVYRRRNFSFEAGGKEYTHRIINVTAHYAVKAYNRIRQTLYIKNGWRYDEVAENMADCAYVLDGELVAIQCDTKVQNPLPPSVLGKYFYLEDGEYRAKINIATEVSVADIREELYEKGFYCDGIHYVRYKRSAGSSRVGKCLYIDERLYPAMHK